MRISSVGILMLSMLSHVKCLRFHGSRVGGLQLGNIKTHARWMTTAGTDTHDHSEVAKNFVTFVIENDIAKGFNGGRVVTRFPPEPNGYLHLGHAKSINFNFGVAKAYNGVTHMRFDDTNPAKEDMEYVKSILSDVKWLMTGSANSEQAPWFGPVRHASDYFQTIYDAAEYLITNGLAYVDHLTPEEMKMHRGTLTEPGIDSPYRTRSIEENLSLFRAMKAGEFPDGRCVLRAKIDMKSPNLNMRDPTLYRIKREPHPITGSQWYIYPMYDFAHAISDALEGITHSLCTLEFDNHRPLYDWIVDQLMPSDLLPFREQGWRPHQYEFSRLNLQYTVLSKRKLIDLVTRGHVEGWDDPRLPTISALRRRGFPASAVRLFCDRVGISKVDNNIDISVLEDAAREFLDPVVPRLFAIAKPLKVKITNWNRKISDPEIFSAESHPKRTELGHRELPFTGELFIDREDFFDTQSDIPGGTPLAPPKGYKRLLPGGQVRLKYAYVITCNHVVRDRVTNEVVELQCTYEPATRAGQTPAGSAKVKGIIQWISQSAAVPADLYLYDRLFVTPSPGKGQHDGDFLRDLNPHSLEVVHGAVVEPSVAQALAASSNDVAHSTDGIASGTFQFERVGYFAQDIPQVSTRDGETPPVKPSNMPLRFNRIVTLRDTWQNHFVEAAESSSIKVNVATGAQNVVSQVPVVEDVRRIELRVGEILRAEKHPDADSLYVLQVQCAAAGPTGSVPAPRSIISGLAGHIALTDLVGRKVVVVCNLKPSKMRGVVSEGMLLAAAAPKATLLSDASAEETVELVAPPATAPVGELITIDGYGTPTPDAVLKSKSALEAWKRVSSELATNGMKEASYGKAGGLLRTSVGPCTVPTLAHAQVI